MTDLYDFEPAETPPGSRADTAPRSAKLVPFLGAAGFTLSLLAIAAVAAMAAGYLKLGSTGESALAQRLDKLAAEIATLKQATDANAATLSDRQRQDQKLSEKMASLTQRLELSQIQVAEKLGSLSREISALQDATASAATPATGTGRR